MKRLVFSTGIPVLLLTLLLSACSKPNQGLVIPEPAKKEAAPENEQPGPSGPTEPSSTLCSDIGQTPIVLAYFTEYTEVLPEPTLLTHINYAHGRFKNPKTGDGGIVITESKQAPISKVVALKSKNPKLKVLLMIGGWGAHADGFSMMARDAGKRTAFCQSVKSLLDKHQLDGVDIDWEYPTQSADNETGCDPKDTQNFNLVLQELRETLGTTKIFEYSVKYYEIPDILSKGVYRSKPLVRAVKRQWDATSMVPFLVDDSGKNVLSYDDPESVEAKGKYIMAKGMLGGMFWEYRYDTADHALLIPLVKALYGGKETVL